MESSRIRLSADVGGTFTDVAAFDETTGELQLGKSAHHAGAARRRHRERREQGGRELPRGAAVPARHDRRDQHHPRAHRRALRAAHHAGFRDIYEIGRVNRPESYNLFFRRHEPLIERDLRYEIRERMDSQGKVLLALDEDQVRAAVADAVAQGAQAIAILFLHSYRNPAHEQRVKAIIEASHPQLFVTASHELSQEYREFERTSTAAANAYVGPRVRRYLGEMGEHLEAAGFDGDFLIVQSTGGLFGVEEAQSACIRMLESGPAAGVIGTKALCDSIGLDERDCLRHGRHHRQGRRHPRRRGADDRQRTDRRLCHRAARADPDDRHPGGRHRRRLDRARRDGRPARRAGKRRRPARPGLLRTRRRRADHHRRQSHSRAARRRPLPRRRDAARPRGRQARAGGARRQAARARPHAGGRRHSAHRHHQDVPHGALGHHRARPRRRRFHARRLWRRRAVARGHGRARAAHRQGRRSRARPGISPPMACWSRICAATSSIPGSRRSPRRRSRPWNDLCRDGAARTARP